MRDLRFALAASVVLNLFLVGAVAGGILVFRVRSPMILAGSLRVAGAELPNAEAKEFRAALQATRRSMRGPLLDGRSALGDAARLMREPTLDRTGMLGALDRARTADMAIRAAVEARAVEFIATLPPVDRTRLADAVQRRADRRPEPAPSP
jgi:uncharacterized membrane protein